MYHVLVNGRPDGLVYRTAKVAEREARKYERLSPTSTAKIVQA